MAMVDAVRPRLGIYYSDANKNKEIQSMIDGALAYFKNAGWNIDISVATIDPLAIEAVTLYCKMAQSTDPAQLMNHPVLISMIAQGRAVTADATV